MKRKIIGSKITVFLILTLLMVSGLNSMIGNQPLIRIVSANPDVQYYNSTDSGGVGEDSWINEYYPTRNYGADTGLYVQSYSAHDRRALIYFDLSSFPSYNTIVNASLELYYYTDGGDGSAGRTHEVHRVTADWDEGTGNYSTDVDVTWNKGNTSTAWTTAGGDFAATATDSSTVPSLNNWIKFNVTSDVSDFLDGTYTNYGWIIKDSSEDSVTRYRVVYWSSEHEGSLAPRLIIEYTTGGGWTNSAPTFQSQSPTGTDISLTPQASVKINDADGNNTVVDWYVSTDNSTWGTPSRHVASHTANTTDYYTVSEATSYSTTYYIKVTANDGHDNSTIYWNFKTKINTSAIPSSGQPVTKSDFIKWDGSNITMKYDILNDTANMTVVATSDSFPGAGWHGNGAPSICKSPTNNTYYIVTRERINDTVRGLYLDLYKSTNLTSWTQVWHISRENVTNPPGTIYSVERSNLRYYNSSYYFYFCAAVGGTYGWKVYYVKASTPEQLDTVWLNGSNWHQISLAGYYRLKDPWVGYDGIQYILWTGKGESTSSNGRVLFTADNPEFNNKTEQWNTSSPTGGNTGCIFFDNSSSEKYIMWTGINNPTEPDWFFYTASYLDSWTNVETQDLGTDNVTGTGNYRYMDYYSVAWNETIIIMDWDSDDDGDEETTIWDYTGTTSNQPPTVSITSPSESATVNGTVNITGTASDSDGTVQSVQVKIDSGSWQTATGTTSWNYSWDSTGVSDGSHTIYARSYDGTDYSTEAQVNVTINNTGNNWIFSDPNPANGSSCNNASGVNPKWNYGQILGMQFNFTTSNGTEPSSIMVQYHIPPSNSSWTFATNSIELNTSNGTKTFDITNSIDTSYSVFKHNDTVTWRAITTDGYPYTPITTSDIWTFTTPPNKYTPIPYMNLTDSPTNGSTNKSLSVKLEAWAYDPDLDKINFTFYNANTSEIIGTYAIAQSSAGGEITSSNKGSVTWDDLEYNTTYYWYVKADDYYSCNSGENKSSFSEIWHFTTISQSLPGITNISQNPSGDVIASNWVNISCDVLNADTVKLNMTLPNSSVDSVSMLHSGTHYWYNYSLTYGHYYYKIFARNTNGSVESSSYNFYQGLGTPPTVTVLYPNTGVTVNGTIYILWNATDDVTPQQNLSIDIKIKAYGSSTPTTIISNTTNDGNYSWNTAMVSDGFYYILVYATDELNNTGSDISDAYFTIDNVPNYSPIADFTWERLDAYPSGKMIKFTDKSYDLDGNITGWFWDFGDGNSTSTTDPYHYYENRGSYTVSHMVLDNEGASSWVNDTIYITANQEPQVLLVSPHNNSIVNVTGYDENGYPLDVPLNVSVYDGDGDTVAILYYVGNSTSNLTYYTSRHVTGSGYAQCYFSPLSTDIFEYGKKFYWNVHYIDYNEDDYYTWHNMTDYWVFTTTSAPETPTNHVPDKPILKYPYNNSIFDIEGNPLIILTYECYDTDWSLYPATTYNDTLKVSLYINDNLVDVTNGYRYNGTSISYPFNPDEFGTWNGTSKDFSWYVVVEDTQGETNQSDTYYFTVLRSINGNFQIIGISPANNSYMDSDSVSLSISVISTGISSISFDFYGKEQNDTDFHYIGSANRSITYLDSVVTTTKSVTWNNLEYNTTYYWYVCCNFDGETNTTSNYSFNTMATNQPPILFNENPENGATGIPVLPTISIWVTDPDSPIISLTFYTDSDEVIYYHKLSNDMTGSLQVTEQYDDAVISNHTYQWYVVADDNDGNTVRYPLSGYLNFTTGKYTPPVIQFRVLNKQGAYLPGVNITCRNTNNSEITDNNGYAAMAFNWEDYNQEYVFTFTKDGYTTKKETIRIYDQKYTIEMYPQYSGGNGSGGGGTFGIFNVLKGYAESEFDATGLLILSIIIIIGTMFAISHQYPDLSSATQLGIGALELVVFIAIGWVPIWIVVLPAAAIAMWFSRDWLRSFLAGGGDES